jgi:UDP-3-O-[3-hydroxymyristoyl] glucosamine N-acyltransferase
MEFKAKDIAMLVNGTIVGNPDKVISNFAKIEEAKSDCISFFSNEKYTKYLEHTEAGVLLVSKDFNLKVSETTTLIKVENAYEATAQLLHYYQSIQHQEGIESPSFVAQSAQILENVYIGAFAYVSENVKIGKNVKIYPNAFIGKNVEIKDHSVIYSGVKIYQDCKIGAHCVIHSGAVIGSDGFGFAPTADGSFQKIPQVGNVVLHDFVEIGANTVVDRATIGSTVIHTGAKLDNLIQVAHNVVIGKNTVIAAQAGISGSTKIGDQVMIGGQAGIVGHIEIANGARINAQSGVSKSIKLENAAVTGSPASDYQSMLKAQVLLKKLPLIWEKLLKLESKLNL